MRRLVSVFALAMSASAARISIFTDSQCLRPATNVNVLLAFSDACTDVSYAYPLALTSCVERVSATALIQAPIAGVVFPPECSVALPPIGSLTGGLLVCTPLPPELTRIGGIFQGAAAFKYTDITCSIPPSLFYVTFENATCTNGPYFLANASNVCTGRSSQTFPPLPSYKATKSGASVSYSLYSTSGSAGVTCTTPLASWSSLPLDRSCTLNSPPYGPSGPTLGLRATAPNPFTPPSPSASPAPYQAPQVEPSAVVHVWPAANLGCSGPPEFAARGFVGICAASPVGFDLGIVDCSASAVSFNSHNATGMTSGTCAGPTLTTSPIRVTLEECTLATPLGAAPVYLRLAAPPTCTPFTPDTASFWALYFNTRKPCDGDPGFSLTIPNTGGPGSCFYEQRGTAEFTGVGIFNYSSRTQGSGSSSLFWGELYNSTARPPLYGCSAAPPYLAMQGAPRDGSCQQMYYFGAPALWGRVVPAVPYVAPTASPSGTPTPTVSASPTPTEAPLEPSTTSTASLTSTESLTSTATLPPGASASSTSTLPTSPSASPAPPSASSSLSLTSSPSNSATGSLSRGTSPSPTASLSLSSTRSASATPSLPAGATPSPTSTASYSASNTNSATASLSEGASPSTTSTASYSSTATFVGAGGGGNAPAANAPSAASSSEAALGGGLGGGLGLLALIVLAALAARSFSRKREAVSRLKGPQNVQMVPMGVTQNPLAMSQLPQPQHHPPMQLPPGWVLQGPDGHGDVWYLHEPSGNTQWDPPTAATAPPGTVV